jgi:hypothetical protein
LKRGRGSRKKSEVLVMAESVPFKQEDGKKTKGKSRRVTRIKMIVIDNLQAKTIDNQVSANIDKDAETDSDDSTSYTNLSKLIAEHRPKVIPKELIGTALPWVHIATGNAKRVLPDISHDIKPEYLQNYLNESCYKFNRRYFGEQQFERGLVASVAYKNEFRYHIR